MLGMIRKQLDHFSNLQSVCLNSHLTVTTFFFFDDSMVTMGVERFEPWISLLETLGDANQLSYPRLVANLAFITKTQLRICALACL